jgi:hypothetical protein
MATSKKSVAKRKLLRQKK